MITILARLTSELAGRFADCNRGEPGACAPFVSLGDSQGDDSLPNLDSHPRDITPSRHVDDSFPTQTARRTLTEAHLLRGPSTVVASPRRFQVSTTGLEDIAQSSETMSSVVDLSHKYSRTCCRRFWPH